MTEVNISTVKNTVEVIDNVNNVIEVNTGTANVVEVAVAGPQGQALSDGNKGDVTVSNNGTAVAINTNAVTSSKILDGTIVNADINASAAIQGTKISPIFGSQNITTTGDLNVSDIVIGDNSPVLNFTDNNADADNKIWDFKCVDNNVFLIQALNDSGGGGGNLFKFTRDGNAIQTFQGQRSGITWLTVDNLNRKITTRDLDVTNNITVTGTVDSVDIATRDTLFGALTSSSGVLTDGVTATTQSAGNNTTRVATTAFVSTAIANLVDSAPGTLNTLNELAAALGDDANFSTTVTNSIATKMPLAGGEFTGNITFSGSQTVDGRDLSVDGAKLDTIESNATADQTKSDIDALGIAASTAATLATARTIAGVSFDGSADISLGGNSSSNNVRKITTSTSQPSGGSDGDLWFTYTA